MGLLGVARANIAVGVSPEVIVSYYYYYKSGCVSFSSSVSSQIGPVYIQASGAFLGKLQLQGARPLFLLWPHNTKALSTACHGCTTVMNSRFVTLICVEM
jgi:hypothetical protein